MPPGRGESRDGFGRHRPVRRAGEDQDVLVDDQVPGLAFAPGFADVLHLEEARPRDDLAAAQAGEQGDVPAGGDQPGRRAGGEDHAGEVGQLAAVPPGPGGDHYGPAGTQQGPGCGEDLGDPGEQVIEAAAGQVRRVGAVAVVVLADTAAVSGACFGTDLAVDAGAVGRGGDDERRLPFGAGGQQARQVAGVAADDRGVAGRAATPGVGDVRGGQAGPAALVFDE